MLGFAFHFCSSDPLHVATIMFEIPFAASNMSTGTEFGSEGCRHRPGLLPSVIS